MKLIGDDAFMQDPEGKMSLLKLVADFFYAFKCSEIVERNIPSLHASFSWARKEDIIPDFSKHLRKKSL